VGALTAVLEAIFVFKGIIVPIRLGLLVPIVIIVVTFGGWIFFKLEVIPDKNIGAGDGSR
jgi:hypothetical protein